MFILDKYCPKTFDKSIINRTIIEKLKHLNLNNMMNVLFYGINGTGKYILSLLLLNNIYGDEIYNLKENVYVSNTKEIHYYSSLFHYEIYLNKYTNKKCLCDLINNLTQTLNISNNNYNLILIKNVQYFDNETFYFIKNILEKKSNLIRFILISNSINRLPKLFTSLFLKVRVPKINIHELTLFLNKIMDFENISISSERLNEIILKYNHNITDLLINIINYKKTKKILEPDYLEIQLNIILDLLKKKKIENIVSIRKYLYSLSSKNINKNLIIKYIYSKINDNISTFEKKKQYIEFTAEISRKLNYSYKDIIHIEFFLIKSMTFIE